MLWTTVDQKLDNLDELDKFLDNTQITKIDSRRNRKSE